MPSCTNPAIRIRLVGDAIREQVRAEMIGFNYLDFLQDENHKARGCKADVGIVRAALRTLVGSAGTL